MRRRILLKTVDVIIPTYHPGHKFKETLRMLRRQSYPIRRIILINTEESLFDPALLEADSDSAVQSALPEISVTHISAKDFDHGASRNLGMQKSDAEYCLSMTDDAIPADERMLEMLVSVLEKDPMAGAAYARQLATDESSLDEQYSRKFNYPEHSRRKTMEDLPALGIKTFFESNVCCLYRKAVFDRLGGFINHTIFNEDMIYCHAMLTAGYASVYCAEACVYHAHNYSGLQQLHRNFDLGISQADHPEVFSGIRAEGEGLKMVKGCIGWLCKSGKGWYIPAYIYKTGMKYLGFRLGKAYRKLPVGLVRRLTMNKNYFV